MAIALDATSTTSATNTSLTLAHTCTGANRILWVSVGVQSNDSTDYVTGVTYNGVAMTRAVAIFSGTSNLCGQYLYVLFAPATGNNSIVVSLSQSKTIYATGMSYTGAAQTNTPDATASAFTTIGSSSTVSTTFSVSATGCWIVSGCSDEQVGSPIPNSGLTARSNPVEGAGGDSNATVSTGSNTVSWKTPNAANGLFTMVSASFAPVAAAAANNPAFLLNMV